MKKITVDLFLKEALTIPIIDVRSPGEYAEGHIPQAVNIPLFTNEERAIVGTLYKQEGHEVAVMKGLEIVGPKMADFARQAKAHAKNNQLLVHCWRGGMRSESMAWLFEKTGIRCQLLVGGYKAYRNYLLEKMTDLTNLIILEGPTGSGKTEILAQLKENGEQVIDLEGLANHRGSSFGGIDQPSQPSTQQFQNNLLNELLKCDMNRPIWIEGESRSIGVVFLPDPFWASMNKARIIEITVPLSYRVQRLVEDYAHLTPELMEAAIQRLKKRLGHLRMTQILELYRQKDYANVAKELLLYYDKAYHFSTDKYRSKPELVELPDGNARNNAALLIKQAYSEIMAK